MDCLDRIAFMMAESAIKPVKLLEEASPLAAVTVRTLSDGHRYNVTVTKTWPDGVRREPLHSWTASEVSEAGALVADGFALQSPSDSYRNPEEAYWAAVEAIDRTARAR